MIQSQHSLERADGTLHSNTLRIESRPLGCAADNPGIEALVGTGINIYAAAIGG